MKKILGSLMVVVMLALSMIGCGKKADVVGITEESVPTTDGKKLSVVTTIFPEYDWVREITKGNENVEITMLLDKGVDLHSFQPTAEDIAKISSCDLFIYVGGESDGWVLDALSEANNSNRKVINLLDTLGSSVKEEEVKEGMQGEEEEEAEEEEGPEYDEHVWLSLRNAKVLCEAIGDSLCEIDADNQVLYQSNVADYVAALEELDQAYETAVEESTIKTVLFGDRFPFRYLVDDYGLDYYAAFVGCSAESEASFETITFLSEKIDELGLQTIFQIESADGKIAETIKENTNTKDQSIVTLDSMQATTAKDVENGATYLGSMQKNLDNVKLGLQ